tara:strand:- start:8229 stop:8876 length:648 start_codon:yes stop_codon:yes gene_type:complete
MISLIISSLSLSFNIKRPYYYDRRIHNLGHLGFPGQIHAEGALLSTKIIDRLRYNGINIRKEIMKEYKNDKILDLCCGVGVSTMNNNIGIDTSPEMLKVARRINKEQNTNKRFYLGNAENFKPKQEFDIVSCMFAFHEMPLYAHNRIIENALKIAKREVIIVDIASNYKPKEIMLSGEPYLIDYMSTIDDTLSCFNKTVYIDEHVNIWKYKYNVY